MNKWTGFCSSIVMLVVTAALAGCGGDAAQKIPTGHSSTSSNEPGGNDTGNTNDTGPSAGTRGGAPGTGSGGGTSSPPVGPTPEGPWPGSQAFFFNFPAQKQASGTTWGTALTDIVRHLNPTYGTQYDYPNDRLAWAALNSHGISAHLRFAYNVTGKPANGFYVLQDRATLFVEPKMNLSDIASRIPPSLRGSRYATYVVNAAKDWNDSPSYLIEEWVGLTNASEVAVDLVKENLWGTQTRDAVSGAFELMVYAFAFGLAAEQIEATYFTDNPLSREFLAWNAERAMRLYTEGAAMPVFANNAQDDYATKWRSSPDGAPLRNFARHLFGATYCVKVLGITGPNE